MARNGARTPTSCTLIRCEKELAPAATPSARGPTYDLERVDRLLLLYDAPHALTRSHYMYAIARARTCSHALSLACLRARVSGRGVGV